MTGNYANISEEKRLLKGICPAAAVILKHRKITAGAIRALKQMKPTRQVEMVEIMAAANNFSRSYAGALLIATPAEQFKKPEEKKMAVGVSNDKRWRMKRNLENLRHGMKSVQENYGANTVRLVVANGYMTRLLDKDRIVQYLARNHTDLLAQIQAVTESIASDAGDYRNRDRLLYS